MEMDSDNFLLLIQVKQYQRLQQIFILEISSEFTFWFKTTDSSVCSSFTKPEV